MNTINYNIYIIKNVLLLCNKTVYSVPPIPGLHPQYNLNSFFLLNTCPFNCSSVVRPFSIDNICNFFTNG